MTHADFCNDLSGRQNDWRLTNWPAAVRIALGMRAQLLFLGALGLILAPSLVIAGYGIYSGRLGLLVWVAIAFLGFWTSSTRPTGIGMLACMVILLIGFVLSVIRHDWLLLVCGMVPGVTWFGSCAILGVTASNIVDSLRSSEDLFQSLTSRGILKAVPATDHSDPPELQ